MRQASAIEIRNVNVIEEVAAIDRRLVRELGERCPEYHPGCMTCQAWRARDDLARILEVSEDD